MSGVLISFLGNTLASGSAVPQVVSNANPMPVTLSGGIGGLNVQGVQANGSIATAFPVIVGGVDGTGILRDLLVDATGALIVSGGGGGNVQGVFANGAVANPNPVVDGVRDSAGNIHSLAGDTTGNAFVVGPAAVGVAANPNPLVIGGTPGPVSPGAVAVGSIDHVFTDSFGGVKVNIYTFLSTGIDGMTNTAIGYPRATNLTSVNMLPPAGQYNFNSVSWDRVRTAASDALAATGLTAAGNMAFNGVTWDRFAKPRTAFRLPSSTASNNAANIKTAPGTVFTISGLVTLLASVCYLKLFDTTGTPNPAALVPIYMFPLSIADGVFSFNTPSQGLYFPTGIGIAIVANPADLDNTAIAAGQITGLNVSFQ